VLNRGLVPRPPGRVSGAHKESRQAALPVIASQDLGNNQYAVLLLNEEQMARLLQRPIMRPINRLASGGTVFTAYTQLIRRARVAMVVAAVLIAGASAWAWAPLPGLGSLPWSGAGLAPTIATGASFSLTLASARGEAATDIARRLDATGIPAFVRPVSGTNVRQVMVGPYVSIDEAETEQRRLVRAGYGTARVFVDDSLRNAPKSGRAPPHTQATPAVVLVGAGEQASLAVEFKNPPRQVRANRIADDTLVVEIGPIDYDVDLQEWSAPAGFGLMQRVAIEEVRVSADARHVRATLTMPASTLSHTRIEGRRVYIDLMRVREAAAPSASRRMASSSAPAPSVAPAPADRAPAGAVSAATVPVAGAVPPPVVETTRAASSELLRPLFGKFERLVPFLQSGASTSAPDVLRALAPGVNEIDAALKQIAVTPETADAHDALASAVASARRVIDSGFDGDRVVEARQAAMLAAAAKSVMPAMPPAR
jgi:hypothetical protein